MLNFLTMAFDYEQRKVARYECAEGMVSTARVTDSTDPYETGISYDPWGKSIVITQTYKNRDDAEKGHKIWVDAMKNGTLPKEKPMDAGTNVWAELSREAKQWV